MSEQAPVPDDRAERVARILDKLFPPAEPHQQMMFNGQIIPVEPESYYARIQAPGDEDAIRRHSGFTLDGLERGSRT